MSDQLQLSSLSLPTIRQAGKVAVFDYDRTQVTPGIVHFGVGGFHRAHQARYVDELMRQGDAMDFGIIGMGVMASDSAMRDALAAQDHLYTLVEKSPEGEPVARVIGSIVDYVFAPDSPARAVETLCAENIRIVSLTVTEGGYNFDHVTGEFKTQHPLIKADIEALRRGEDSALTSFFGLTTAAIIRRRAAGTTPFTIMSCDNIQGNGDVARTMFLAFAEAVDPELSTWIAEHITFPNSMVDRITPETTDGDRADVLENYGFRDLWPVVCEDFTQWALEDSFVADRPAFEKVGVQVVEDVVPYELMKLRLLNASHQGLCYFGYLAGHRLVHDIMADQRFRDFLLAYMEREATPTLQPVPGIDLDDYRHQLIARFGNAAVKDTVARLCAESSDRIPKWLLPVIRENIAAGRPVDLSAAIVASWARYDEGIDEAGEPINIVDRMSERLRANAARNRQDATAFIQDREVFGDLVDEPAFTTPYVRALESLHAQGSERTIDELLAD